MTREEFFNKLKTGAKWDVGVAINRTNPVPLDANEIFESVAMMETYIKSNALAYPGQIVVVLGDTETAAYLVNAVGGEGKGYSKLAATTGSGDVGEELTNLAARVATVEGYFESGVAKKATADAAGNVIADTYATKTELSTTEANAQKGIADAAAAKQAADAAQATADAAVKTADFDTFKAENTAAIAEAKKAGTDATAALNAYKTTNDAAVQKNADDIATINGKITGLTGAMHFVGTSTTDPMSEGGATVDGHESFASGDVCLFGNKEFVYNGAAWVELGDEGSHLTKTEAAETYATKTALEAVTRDYLKSADKTELEGKINTAKSEAITEAGTAADGKIAEALRAYTTTEGLTTELDKKVDKVLGKSLVDDTLIAKMEGIKDNAAIKGVEGGIKLDAETGKISIDAANVPVIAQDKVDGLVDALAAKKDEAGVNALIAAATIKAEKIEGVVAEADKVSNALIVGGKSFDGSKDVEITAADLADLGALTAIERATDSAFGGIMVGYTSTEENRAVQLDETGRAYVNVPKAAEALVKSVSAEFEVSAEGQLSVKSVNVNKLAQTDGDKLVLDGGNANSY